MFQHQAESWPYGLKHDVSAPTELCIKDTDASLPKALCVQQGYSVVFWLFST